VTSIFYIHLIHPPIQTPDVKFILCNFTANIPLPSSEFAVCTADTADKTDICSVCTADTADKTDICSVCTADTADKTDTPHN
jgi:hypothetical protein